MKCSVDECDKVAAYTTLKLCKTHYARFRRNGHTGTQEHAYVGHIDAHGYIRVWLPDEKRHEYKHRVVMEQKLGRSLYPDENVHHKNGNRADNSPDNLELWVKSQPAGQRPEDLLEWADEIIRRYR